MLLSLGYMLMLDLFLSDLIYVSLDALNERTLLG